MSEKLQAPRGTQDLMGDEYRAHAHITAVANQIAETYGYEPIATPIFESTSVFKRTIGETSDIVGKEMYTFQDRGGDDLTLRPEGTAGAIRAVISNGLTQNMPLKLMYTGPMFRYERPQLGRRRQFHQIGVECLGVSHPYVDVETIALGYQILKTLGLADRVVLEINTIGDTESRQAYRQALINYFTPMKDKLSHDSQDRLMRNPLRILDSKDEGDRVLVKDAPQFEDYLNELSKSFFAEVCVGLDSLNIPYQINRRLVRGLDYYNHTAFEFVTTDLGAQGTVLAGGRYDGLMSQMGGPETAGVGWALGIERLALMITPPQQTSRPVALVPVGDTAFASCFDLAMALRQQGIASDIAYSGNVGKRLKRANKINAGWAVMIGDDELASGVAVVKTLDSGEQKNIAISDLISYFKSDT
ncbi:MAG: histidine--tRNA ligase [Candidatus Paracaedibacteraceae bacterium]|nr:histidine--tRNA ligase [Candidatus Paracaedibacteraceae bacterium]